MPDEPLINLIAAELVEIAEGISRAEGYAYDYGEVATGAVADWDAEKDFERPRIFLAYDSEVPQDELVGAESATQRFRRFERYILSVCVKGSEEKAHRMKADLHAAFLNEDDRFLTNGRGAVFEAGTEWLPLSEAGDPIGGVLAVVLIVRWEHVSGDMTTTT